MDSDSPGEWFGEHTPLIALEHSGKPGWSYLFPGQFASRHPRPPPHTHTVSIHSQLYLLVAPPAIAFPLGPRLQAGRLRFLDHAWAQEMQSLSSFCEFGNCPGVCSSLLLLQTLKARGLPHPMEHPQSHQAHVYACAHRHTHTLQPHLSWKPAPEMPWNSGQ